MNPLNMWLILREVIKVVDYRNYRLEDWQRYLKEIGEPAFRAKQIMKWIVEGVTSFDEMTNLSKKLRDRLALDGYLDNAKIVKSLSAEDGTVKYLLQLREGAIVEAVLMKYHYGYSVCLSTQVGCRMGCQFCASTIDGMDRNITAGEMLGMFLVIQKSAGERIGRFVLMGSGEPFDNYDEVVSFIRRMHDPEGLNVSYRNMTLSTCGIVPGIERLSNEDLPITLAVSLHAADDVSRSQLMPINKKYPIATLLAACHQYTAKTGRRITFEYALIRGKNDQPEQAETLARLLKDGLFHVNLIPINPVAERDFLPSEDSGIKNFQKILLKRGIETTIRRELGSEIQAACGQLRRSVLGKKSF